MHEASTAVDMIRSARAGKVLTLTEHVLPSPQAIGESLRSIAEQQDYDAKLVDWSVFEGLSARHSAHMLAKALDRACERSFSREREF